MAEISSGVKVRLVEPTSTSTMGCPTFPALTVKG